MSQVLSSEDAILTPSEEALIKETMKLLEDDQEQNGEGTEENFSDLEEDEAFYFDYEEEMRKQEEILLERYGSAFNMGTNGTPLTKSIISSSLSNIGIPCGTEQIAYLTFDGSSKNLSDIDELQPFIYLTNVILSNNQLVSLQQLEGMEYLRILNAERNSIESIYEIPLGRFKWLQALHLGSNKLNSLDGFLPIPSLSYLHLGRNNLEYIQFMTEDYLPNLLSLELRGNELKSIEGIQLPSLRQLFISENRIENLDGIQGCPSLEFLHARRNSITEFVMIGKLQKLEYLNLRENHVQKLSELKNFQNCLSLKTLIMDGNPICKSERYKIEVISICKNLKRLDKLLISEKDVVEGIRHEKMRSTDQIEEDPSIIFENVNEENEEFKQENDFEAEEE